MLKLGESICKEEQNSMYVLDPVLSSRFKSNPSISNTLYAHSRDRRGHSDTHTSLRAPLEIRRPSRSAFNAISSSAGLFLNHTDSISHLHCVRSKSQQQATRCAAIQAMRKVHVPVELITG